MPEASALESAFGPRLKTGEPLSAHVNFRLGGPARFFVEAKSADEIETAVRAALSDGMKFVILGGGTNVLPSDEGFDGLVILAANRGWKTEDESVTAEAGAPTASVARATAEAGLTGFEWGATVPGTIGGAVRGNAGCYGGETKDVVETVEALRVSGNAVERVSLSKAECGFGYRESVFKTNSDVVLAARLKLKSASRDECLARIEANVAKRRVEQPLEFPSAGCMFKNFEYRDESEIEKLRSRLEIPSGMLERKRISAGWLVEQADLKGKKIGGAMVSTKHGNFLLNVGGATASDVLQLISMVKMRIRDDYGIQLEEEVQLIGF